MAKFGIGARAIDLLGRQQVAGTPTAISELFKNAHDAYARNIVVDFYRVKNLLVLRDDGVGMSRRDFETRWLTAATDSKRESGYMPPPEADPDQPLRPVMGEKGIGRLAIAVLGKQVLVLTRQKSPDASKPLVVALLHWDVFSLPNIQLGDIEIPLRELEGGTLPDRVIVSEMVQEAVRNLEHLSKDTDPKLAEQIIEDLRRFDVDPASLASVMLEGPDLRGKGYGTHFYILPTNETLALDVDEVAEDEKATPMQKALLGFSNTMVPGHTPPPMRTAFRDHKGGGLWEDIIGSNQFFTPQDFESSDHQVSGAFDEHGQFSGSIRVFNGEVRPLRIHWPNGKGQPTKCGPFTLSFAYVQGTARETLLPRDRWNEMIGKLNRIGGLYLYRDNIRILPYGDSDYDFLDIERRRTKHAGYYFFSYRRMLGVIETTKRANANLVEKAGREGFQANAAYKEFRAILENFFIQLAAEFFREGGTSSDEFFALREENAKNFEILKKREQQIATQRRKLSRSLEWFFEKMAERSFEDGVHDVVASIESRLARLSEGEIDPGEIRRMESSALAEIAAISRDSRIVRPRAVGLTKEQSRQWASYEAQRSQLENSVYLPAMDRVRSAFAAAKDRLGMADQARQLAYETISEISLDSQRQMRKLSSDVRSDADGFHERVVQLTKDSIRTVREAIEGKLIAFEREASANMTPEQISRIQSSIEAEIRSVTERQSEILQKIASDIASVASDGPRMDELLTAMETDLEDRRDREELSMRLAQMGQAIGIVHHEFSAAIRTVRRNVRRLESWADRNEKFRKVYDDITQSYAHLDSYLSLFAPLSRGLDQTKRVIRGSEVTSYLMELLGDRLRRHNVELIATSDFQGTEIEAFVSTIYPAFVNLVDNSIYWLNHGQYLDTGTASNQRPKRVILDRQDNSLLISDSGPGVLPGDEYAVFETGFSRKPGGTGLGLSITHDVLNRQGFQLTLDLYEKGEGATFRIRIPDDAILEDSP
ncbi:ATP-binding protein [Agrobacterium sp. RAC06]|uniref:ATP-binding protein n=1 Tax=Agrobacterium sp. RAC06 TaxID=1842536 RepID=UPI00083D7EEA|nr:ATP-binding protein [Agrobacterium sp. RAC06]AOG09916.1 histidine kinase-, DNA gyrase B-, and HSP90-like ATPase family protein [Agrobacterium sp. RAC06]